MIDQNAEPPIAEPASSDISSPDRSPVDCPEIVPSSIEEGAGASGHAGLNDDEEQWVSTVHASLQTRSAEVREALEKALRDGRKGVGPLLGTNTSQHAEILGKSSRRRSPKRVCYGSLLRFGADSRTQKSLKSAINGPADCYGSN